MRKAFTLIELLVVIGIIGLLMSALFVATSGVSDRAKSVKCTANLKSLASACNARAMGSGFYPPAQSYPYQTVNPKGKTGTETVWMVNQGWLSWLDQGATYPTEDKPTHRKPSYAGTAAEVWHSLTNGVLWSAIGGSHDCYLCPVHAKVFRKTSKKQDGGQILGWSYQMNAFFGYDSDEYDDSGIASDSLGRAEHRLLFAEIPALDPALGSVKKTMKKLGIDQLPEVKLDGGANDEAMDGCLRSKLSGGDESIGFNHVQGKQIWGHAVFADGHVESFAAPKDGNFKDLTDWLCRGLDVVYVNGKYEKVDTTATGE